MVILNFGPDTCSDCHRPPNVGGIHNSGCQLSLRRLCVLCDSMHDNGEDVHRDAMGVYCSYEQAIAAKIRSCPGWTKDRCVAYVDRRRLELKRDMEVYEWIRAVPINTEILMAALRGVRD